MSYSSSSGITNSVRATVTSDISFSYTETSTTATQRNESDKLGYSYTYAYGSGTGVVAGDDYSSGTINAGVKLFGQLDALGTDIIDMSSIPKELFGGEYNLNYDVVKSIVLQNRSTSFNSDISVIATGATALTGMFNGGSENVLIKPSSTYIFNDPYGTAIQVDANHKDLYLYDTNGSGALYSVVIVGTTG